MNPAMSPDQDMTIRERNSTRGDTHQQMEAAHFTKPSARDAINSLGLLDVLDSDYRPTFILDSDVSLPPDDNSALEPVYCNPTLTASEELLAKVTMKEQPSTVFTDYQLLSRFRSWIVKPPITAGPLTGARADLFVYEGYIWTVVACGRFLIVSGVQVPLALPEKRTSSPLRHPNRSGTRRDRRDRSDCREPRRTTYAGAKSRCAESRDISLDSDVSRHASPLAGVSQRQIPNRHKYGPFDCTMDPPPEEISEHVHYFRSVDWSDTPLGPLSTWSPELRTLVNMSMNDNNAAVLFWGEDLTMIYNEAYVPIIGLLHPCMGRSVREVAQEYWHLFQPIVDHINLTGKSMKEPHIPLFLDRHGFLEETFFSFQFIPHLDSDGCIAGYYQILLETTKYQLLERRVSGLVEIGSQTAKARNMATFWRYVLDTLAINDKDAPFALLYSTEHNVKTDIATPNSSGITVGLERCHLQGSIAVTADHPIAPSIMDLKEGSHAFVPFLLQAAKSGNFTLVQFHQLDMPESLLDDIQWKGYRDPCRSFIVCPIIPTTGEQVQGFLILGVNPRRPFDEDYQQFIHVMSRLLATSLASVVLFDEEIHEKENAISQAARIQDQLLAELKLKEKKFQRFAERSDVAIFITDEFGTFTYRNQRFFDLLPSASRHSKSLGVWNDVVCENDRLRCEEQFAKMAVDKIPICFDIKTQIPWTPPDTSQPTTTDGEHYVWVACSLYPELDEGDKLIEIVGNVTCISKLKWAQDVQRSRFKSALESRKQLENFIDTTSHEMRNPLSAIMQSADGIIASYSMDGQTKVPSPTTYSKLLDQTLDAAQTISQCALHMKRIVDDILTISKLDSGLLVFTPVDAQPDSVTNHVFRMFEAEAKAADVDVELVVEQSYRDLNIGWVSLDPTRTLQILINLITNAVKFTRFEATRQITMSISASATEPASVPGGIQFVGPRLVPEDKHLVDDWKLGETVYIQYSVSDTGRGLSEEEKAVLFARFSQASPRTHIHYGGSGLGLFISRRLTEMQGGAIGLKSEFKKGSTFSFYIKVRRSNPPMLRRGSLPNIFPDDLRDQSQTKTAVEKQIKKPLLFRQPSIHLDIPSEGVHSADPGFAMLTRAKSIPETLHVLVVEDNLVNQKVLAKQLRNLGCVVDVANHGVEALDFLKKTKYWDESRQAEPHPAPALGNEHLKAPTTDSATLQPTAETQLPLELNVILMDWEMPVMNGLDCVQNIRALQSAGTITYHIPVIGATANVRQQQIQTAMEAGMDDVVGKPFRVKELLDRMKGLIKGMGENSRGGLEVLREVEGDGDG